MQESLQQQVEQVSSLLEEPPHLSSCLLHQASQLQVCVAHILRFPRVLCEDNSKQVITSDRFES